MDQLPERRYRGARRDPIAIPSRWGWFTMRIVAFTFMTLCLVSCGSSDSIRQCFPCQGYWICGGAVERIDLTPDADGCFLSGLPGRNLLSPDGTITANGVVVGSADGTGASVHVAYPDGSQWLFCRGGGGCPRTQ